MAIGNVNYGGSPFPWGPPRGKFDASIEGLTKGVDNFQAAMRDKELMDRQRGQWAWEDEQQAQQRQTFDQAQQMIPQQQAALRAEQIMALMGHLQKKLEILSYDAPGSPEYFETLQTLKSLEQQYLGGGGMMAGSPPPPTGTPGATVSDPAAQLQQLLPGITDAGEKATLQQVIMTGTPEVQAEAVRRIMAGMNDTPGWDPLNPVFPKKPMNSADAVGYFEPQPGPPNPNPALTHDPSKTGPLSLRWDLNSIPYSLAHGAGQPRQTIGKPVVSPTTYPRGAGDDTVTPGSLPNMPINPGYLPGTAPQDLYNPPAPQVPAWMVGPADPLGAFRNMGPTTPPPLLINPFLNMGPR